MSNKETIEEAAEKEYPTIHELYQYDAFIKGAKWQAKTMYSEEILNILNKVLYWDTCPNDYKVVISNFLSKQNNEQ